MEDLTDINEILKYLTSVGYSYKYNDKYIILYSEYFLDLHISTRDIFRCYKKIYMNQTDCQLLNSLLINCQICYKYVGNNYNMRVGCAIYPDKIDLYFNGKYISRFKNINDLMTYINEHYPECIRQVDIKIALK
jgi:hypothetical protein